MRATLTLLTLLLFTLPLSLQAPFLQAQDTAPTPDKVIPTPDKVPPTPEKVTPTPEKVTPTPDKVPSTSEKLVPASEKQTGKFLLAYRFKPGETIRSKVVHLVTVETRIKGTTQVAKTRSVSTKSWQIESVDKEGNITFVHSVADVDMWQSVTGRQVVRYNSQKDKLPPVGYEAVAESVGMPLSTVTIDPSGRVKERKDTRPLFNPGIGDLTVPLPKEPVAEGHRWMEPDEVQLRLPGEPLKRIKTRQVYTLRKVQTGVATIDVKTEVLTPLDDPALEAQLVQRLQQGTVKFDLDAGRLLTRQMDMDKTVLGFSGAESQMEYLARFTEEMLGDEAPSVDTSEAQPPASSTEKAARQPVNELRR